MLMGLLQNFISIRFKMKFLFFIGLLALKYSKLLINFKNFTRNYCFKTIQEKKRKALHLENDYISGFIINLFL
jgi:hypothetical protein